MRTFLICFILTTCVVKAEIYKCGNTYSDKICSFDAETIELHKINTIAPVRVIDKNSKAYKEAYKSAYNRAARKDMAAVRRRNTERFRRYQIEMRNYQIKENEKRQRKNNDIFLCIIDKNCRITK